MNSKKNRRQFLRESLTLGAGLMFSDRLLASLAGLHFGTGRSAGPGVSGPAGGRARSVVYIYLDGGSSQTDTFDPKPEAGRDYVGNYRNPIATNVPGITIGEKLPRLAQLADRYSLLRGMVVRTNAHETAHYRMQTGDLTGGSIVYPSFGSMISYLKEGEYRNPLFPYITLTAASTRFNEAGFLPPKYKPYDTGGSPGKEYFDVSGIYDHTVPDSLLLQRKALLEMLAPLGERVESTEEVRLAEKLRAQNYRLILGDTRRVFDLSEEPEDLRQSYGMTDFGQSCLAARKLVQAGVLMVVVRFRGWDTHKEHFKRMDARLEELDKGVSSLLLDLEKFGLLDRTVVLCGGEFGRTPRIAWGPPWNGGRGHWGDAFSYLVAGGGFRGGAVVGKTDAKGEQVVDRPVYPADLWASVYSLMGIDPKRTVVHPTRGEIPILPSFGVEGQSGGMLTEIMR